MNDDQRFIFDFPTWTIVKAVKHRMEGDIDMVLNVSRDAVRYFPLFTDEDLAFSFVCKLAGVANGDWKLFPIRDAQALLAMLIVTHHKGARDVGIDVTDSGNAGVRGRFIPVEELAGAIELAARKASGNDSPRDQN